MKILFQLLEAERIQQNCFKFTQTFNMLYVPWFFDHLILRKNKQIKKGEGKKKD